MMTYLKYIQLVLFPVQDGVYTVVRHGFVNMVDPLRGNMRTHKPYKEGTKCQKG